MSNKEYFIGEYQELWEDIEKRLDSKGRANGTIENRRKALTSFIKHTKSTNLSDLEDLESVETFMKNFRIGGKRKDSSLKLYLKNISNIIKNSQKRKNQTGKGYTGIENFKRNQFQFVLDEYTFKDDIESHKPRTKLEIEIWIKLIREKQYKLFFMFCAMGLRLFEVLELRRGQLNIEDRAILDVRRKGNKKPQEKLGLPKWIVPHIVEHLKTVDDKLFTINKGQIEYFIKKHFKNLTKMREKLEKKGNLNNYWQRIKNGLDLIVENKFISHSLRGSWNTLAIEGRMFEDFRKFHMNHSTGIQKVYSQIYNIPSTWREYLNELDNHSPQFVF